jgi:hypothetical protein
MKAKRYDEPAVVLEVGGVVAEFGGKVLEANCPV